MSTPLANKTTFSSRMKMSATIGPKTNGSTINHNNNHLMGHNKVNGTEPKAPPRTTHKSITSAANPNSTDNKPPLPQTSSRIAPPRSSLPKRVSNPKINSENKVGGFAAPTLAAIQRSSASTFSYSRSSSKLSSSSSAVTPRISQTNHVSGASSRTNSNLGSVHSRLASNSSIHAATTRKSTLPPTKSNYVPDTNSMRRGLAKFSNPIECQRQFQSLSSEIRQLKDINENKDNKISKLQEQLDDTIKQGVCYATIVQYFAGKLKINTDGPDLVTEYNQLRCQLEKLLQDQAETESRINGIIEEYNKKIECEQDLRDDIKRELEKTKEAHSTELTSLIGAHKDELNDLIEKHASSRLELESKIASLSEQLNCKTEELEQLRKDHEMLTENYNKLEESLTRDKDARVKYAQEKISQLQKEVDSLNSVLEMRTEKMHSLEKDSIMLGEAQQELAAERDYNKALKQQLESLNAALDIKREKFENLIVEKEKISLELKRERKERRRMTMRTEQLEYALNESFANDNITLLDPEIVES